MTDHERVAFLGLGTMGAAIADHLVDAGVPLIVWNRTQSRCDPFAARGARVATTPADAVSDASIVLYCLGAPDAFDDVVFGASSVLDGIRPGSVAIDLGTNHPAMSRRQAAAYADKGAEFLDIPLFGSRPEAEAADLCLVVGGATSTLERVRPILETFSSSIHHMGDVGQGASMGLIGSLIVGLQIQALAEALVMGKRAGLDVDKVVEIIQLPDFRSPLFGGMGPAIIDRDFAPVFSLAHLEKDVDFVAALADDLEVPLPGSVVVREMVKLAIQHDHAHENASALVKALEVLSGVTITR